MPSIFPVTILLPKALQNEVEIRKLIQNQHQLLRNAMAEDGVLDKKFEGNYPANWMRPNVVAEYHPIFFVDGRGNIHFLRERKSGEAAKQVWQQTKIGRAGFTLWRWRAYLRPPKFPAREASKAREWVARMTGQLRMGGAKLAPARVRGMRFRRRESAGRQRVRPR